jgi:two-component system alkaline phosphatase synthesis response regulator PhoP
MKKILVVDDDPEMVDLVKARLEAGSYQVLTAFDGVEAIQKAQQYLPDLILMDIIMPQMLGGDAVKILQKDNLTKRIPVIFLTVVSADSSQDGEDQEININGKFFPSIPKPFGLEQLLLRVRGLIGN